LNSGDRQPPLQIEGVKSPTLVRYSVLLMVLIFALGPLDLSTGATPGAPLIRLEGLSYGTKRQFGAGERITFALRGTARGSATLHIFNVASGLGMREVRTGAYEAQPALYTGTFVVSPGNAVRRGAVFAALTVGGVEVMTAGPQPITIDTRPPIVTARYPQANVTLSNARPNVLIEFADLETRVNPATARLLVDGQNVTARASISETAVAYNPGTPFRPGPVRVQFFVADEARNVLRSDWRFQVAPPSGLISAVTVNPATALTGDDVLTVVVTGTPGARASFSIEGVRGKRPMRESGTQGIYFGTIAVRQLNDVFGAPLLATLEKDGRKSSVQAAVPVTILSRQPPAPTISTSSRSIALEDPAARLTLDGTTQPGFRILGRVDYETRSAALEGGGTLGEFLTIAGPNGRWRISLGPLVPLPRARLIVTVVAIDPAGRRSPPATLEVTSS